MALAPIIAEGASAVGIRNKINASSLTFELNFGAIGDGVTDDTAAINAAAAYSAANDVQVKSLLGKSGRFLVSTQGNKTFRGGTGGTYSAGNCIDVPSGASLDFNGATIVAVSGSTATLMSNSNPLVLTDEVDIRNVKFDGNNIVPAGGLVTFIGCTNSRFVGFEVFNVQRGGLEFYALSNSVIDDIYAHDITGQAIFLGGNTTYQLLRCTVGTLRAERINTYGTVNQPGNPFLIGAKECTFGLLKGRNCAGGIKFAPNCTDLNVGACEFDGLVLSGETDYNSANSGTKLQGDVSTDGGCTRLTISRIVSRRCAGSGLYIFDAFGCSIGIYNGYLNGTLGADADVSALNINDLQIDQIYSTMAGQNGVNINASTGSNSGKFRIGSAVIRSTGQVVAAGSKVGFNFTGGRGRVETLQCTDDQGSVTMSKGLQVLNGITANSYIYIGEAHLGGSNPIDVRWGGVQVDNLRLGGNSDPLAGQFAPTAAATTTAVANGNIRTANSAQGYIEPQIDIVPMNDVAATLMASKPLRATFVNGTVTFRHAAAAGGEKFSYSIRGYSLRTDQFA